MWNKKIFIGAVLLSSMAACGGEDVGTAQIFLDAEETVSNGLQAGAGEENIVDGWNVTYDSFLVTIGELRAESTATGDVLEEPKRFVVDFKNGIPAGGLSIADFVDVAALRYDSFSYAAKPASVDTEALGTVAQADLDLMRSEGLSWLVRGRLTEAAAGTGQSCQGGTCQPVAEVPFEFKITSSTVWSDCEEQPGGNLGFSVPSGGTVQIKPTIHGDHWFFSNFGAGGVEITERRAQYMADAAFGQIGGDILVTLDVLAGVNAADAFPADLYSLAGALIPVNTAADFVIAQTSSNGHLNGEGECPSIELTQ